MEIEVSVDDSEANGFAQGEVAQAVMALLNPVVEESQATGTTGTGRRIIQGASLKCKDTRSLTDK